MTSVLRTPVHHITGCDTQCKQVKKRRNKKHPDWAERSEIFLSHKGNDLPGRNLIDLTEKLLKLLSLTSFYNTNQCKNLVYFYTLAKKN